VPDPKSAVGLIVSSLPLAVTLAAVTAMVSTTELSDTFLRKRLPLPFWMASLKLITKLAPTPTPVALSAGLKLLAVGGVVSAGATVLKFQVLLPVIPA